MPNVTLGGCLSSKLMGCICYFYQILVNTTTTGACLCTMLIEMNTLGVQMLYSHAGAKDEENAYT